MRKHDVLGLAVVSLALVAGATGALSQTPNAGAGAGQPFLPGAQVRGGPGAKWPSAIEDYNRGVAALRAKKYKDAIASFSRALRGAPRDSSVWTMLGLSKEGAGDLGGAHDAYAKAVGFNDGNIAARQRLAVTGVQLGQTDEARAQLAELQKQSDACGPGCPDADRLRAAIATVQDAIAHGQAGG